MDCKDKILSNDYWDIITDFNVSQELNDVYDMCSVRIDDTYNAVYINSRGLSLTPTTLYDYPNLPKLYGLMDIADELEMAQNAGAAEPFDPNSLLASGIIQVQRLPLNLTGRGVVLCFIDTGIDYTNEVFRDETGNSRILAIWDQTIQNGAPPEGYLYGTEYTREDINRALQTQEPYSIVPSRDTNGHGSTIASVAAGSRVDGGRTFLGAAPDSDIVVVKLKECKQYLRDYYLIPDGVPAYEEQDIMLAVKYADSFAVLFHRPVVICLGIGTNMGDHSGNSALSGYIDSIAVKRSRAVVVCGGNEGNAAHHYRGVIEPQARPADNNKDVEIRVGENNRGFMLEFWGNIPDTYNIEIRSPGGETIPPLRIGIDQLITYGFIYERTRISIGSVLVEPSSGEELILFRVEQPTAGIWTFRVTPVGEVHNGIFHMWLPITEFLSSEVYFLEPDPHTTLTEPAMAYDVMSVSTYNDLNNSFYIESGRGFTRNGLVNPDLAAPGVNVSTIYGKKTGSSLAAAITAGGVAQFMQWAVVEGNNERIENQEVKNFFIRGAFRSPELTYPNREWGYGRLNVAGTFEQIASF